jgi:hypothetical protein
VHHLEDAGLGPLGEASVARAATTELRRDRLPLAAGAQTIEDAAHCATIREPRTSAFGAPSTPREPNLDAIPQLVGDFGEARLHPQYRSYLPGQYNFFTRF